MSDEKKDDVIAGIGVAVLPCSEAPPDYKHAPDCTRTKRDGPAKVTTDAYRDGWDTIFGKKTPIGQA